MTDMMIGGEKTDYENRSVSRWERIKPAAAYILAAACLVWVFHDIPLRSLTADLAGINWWWIVPAIAADVLSYIAQGLRWQLLLVPVGRINIIKTTQAIYAGLFLNEILPMRPGELARVFLVSRWLGTDIVSTLPSLAVERLMDGIWLAVAIGISAIFVHELPPELHTAADVFGLVVIVLTLVFLLLVLRRGRAGYSEAPVAGGLRARIAHFLSRTAAGIRAIGRSRSVYLAFGGSFLHLLLQVLAFWLVMRACGLRAGSLPMTFWAGTMVFLIVHLGTALPNAPANVGAYQFFTVLGLALFEVEKAQAASFSLIVFLLLTIPLWVLGFWAISLSGTTMASLREDIARLIGRKVSARNVVRKRESV